MYHLIIPSNLNMSSFENVLLAYYDKYKEFHSILILETEESDKLDLNKRSKIIRDIFTIDIEIREKNISKNTNEKITEIINNSLRQYKREEIVVDLTNGTKEISSLLYMAASLSQIYNINYVVVGKDEEEKFFVLKEQEKENLSKFYSIKNFRPLQDLNSLGRWNYFDLLFYKDKIKKILETYPAELNKLTDTWEIHFKNGLELYFSGEEKYNNAIQTFGVLLEDVSNKLYEALSNVPEYNSKNKRLVFEDFFNNIRKKHKDRDIFSDYRDKNFVTDYLFNIVREYRNRVAHPSQFKFSEIDVQVIIMIIIIIISNIKDVFQSIKLDIE